MEKAWFSIDVPQEDGEVQQQWRACTVHGYSSQVLPHESTAASVTAVAIVEDDETSEVRAVAVARLRFKNPNQATAKAKQK